MTDTVSQTATNANPYDTPVVEHPWAEAEIRPGRDSTGAYVIVVMVDGAVVAQLSPAKLKSALRLLGECGR